MGLVVRSLAPFPFVIFAAHKQFILRHFNVLSVICHGTKRRPAETEKMWLTWCKTKCALLVVVKNIPILSVCKSPLGGVKGLEV